MVNQQARPKARPKRREGVAAQVADGEAVLLDIESGEYFSLNSVGSRIWELCDGTRTAAEIVSVICGEFDVAEDVATADAQEILGEFARENLVVRA
ncbi:MAG: PqqD family protein [Streptosporangiaceae bacterium]